MRKRDLEKDTLGYEPGQENVLVFRLAHQLYGLPIAQVAQIVDMVTIIPIPQVDPAILGVINVHGELVPVIDMRHYLGLEESPLRLHTHIILVNSEALVYDASLSRMLGLIVDEVMDVLTILPEQVINLPEVLPKHFNKQGGIVGVAHTVVDTVLLLDLEKLLVFEQVESPLFNDTSITVLQEGP